MPNSRESSQPGTETSTPAASALQVDSSPMSDWESPQLTYSVQFSSVAQSCPTLCDPTNCDPTNCSTPGLPVHHQLPEFTQTHVIELVMPSSHLILCRPLSSCPQFLPASKYFPMNQFFTFDGQSTGVSALASFLPKKSQG